MINYTKRLAILLVFLSISSVSASPGWLNDIIDSSRSDLISPDAPAYVLYDYCLTEIKGKDKSESFCRYVIMLKSPSAEESVQFDLKTAGLNKIKSFKAWQIQSDGSENTYDKKDLMEVSLFEGTALHHDTKSLKLMIPELNVGDVVAYEYRMESKELSSKFHEFVVQRDLPVRDFEVGLKLPDDWDFQIAGSFADSLQHTFDDGLHVWTAKNLEYRQEEPYMSEEAGNARFFAVNCFEKGEHREEQFATWSDVARWYWHNLPETTGQLEIPSDLVPENETTAGDTSGIFKLDCQLVRDKIRYVGVEIGEGRFRPRAPQLTLENRYGDCKDKAFLLQSLLGNAGVNSYLTLVHSPGPTDPDITTPFQFNHVILAIEPGGLNIPSTDAADTDHYLFFDPTYPALEPGQVPRYLQNDYGIVIRPDTAVVVRLPSTTEDGYRQQRRAEFTIYSKDSLSGEITISYYDCEAGVERYRRSKLSRDKQIEELRSLLGNAIAGVKVANFDASDSGSSVGITATIIGTMAGSMAGDFYLLRTNPIVEALPNLLKTDRKRFFPIWFGEKEVVDCEVVWHLPPGWKIEIPDSVYAAQCSSSSLSARVESPDSATIVWKSQYRHNGRVLPAASIAEAAQFEKARNSAYGSRTLLSLE